MINRLALVFCIGLSVTVSAQTNRKIAKIDSVLTYLHQRQLFNGVVLVGERGKAVYKKAFGPADPVTGQALTTSSSFNLASVSKQFYGMMIMILKEQGKLRYDDPVANYFPTFPYPAITIRHLLNQVSGLPEYFELVDRDMNLLDTLTNSMVLDLLATKKPALVFKPGERWEYCNTNYILLGSLVEKLSGMPANRFFSQSIAKPLKLTNTYVYTLKLGRSPAGRVIGFRYEGGKPVINDLNQFDGVVGDGNVYSSAEDLYKWDQALYTEKLVKRATRDEAFTAGKLNSGENHQYGFGWRIDEPGKTVSHTGSWVGFRTLIVRYVDKNQTLIVLSNNTNSTARVVRDIWEDKPYTLPSTHLITNVRIINGTGLPAFSGSVRIVDDRIADIGNLTPLPGETATDGKGNVLAPGFIDSHSHHDWGLKKNPSCIAATSQGITTIVVGQDGGSKPIDSIQYLLNQQPVSINIATFTGHASLREKAMNGDVLRKSTPEELLVMKDMLKQEMEKGSLGLSTGLEYEPAFYASRDEVIELAKISAAYNGRYISHIRSEDVHIDRALEELIDIGRQASIPVQISHFKIALRSKWGSSVSLLALLQQARQHGVTVTADVYPYSMWGSTPRVLFPKKDFTSLAAARYATTELFDPSASVMAWFPPNKAYEGKTITDIGKLNNEDAAIALLRIIREGEAAGESGYIVATSMNEADIKNFLLWEYSSICSDGSIDGHPRGHGAFTRVLGRYVREQNLMPLEKAVYKMTGLPAQNLGIKGRGLIQPGYFADLVLFNPETVMDNATIENPSALSAGVEMVWVNGEPVYQNQRAVNNYPGVLVKR
ncbi:MAG: serine hydrolase [Flammeovirgaceae bacterium]|nr:MAG: serine hydrolase [Flammeovirgaceae bacterium]